MGAEFSEPARHRAARAPKSFNRGVSPDEIVCLKAKEIIDGIDDGSDESRFLSLARTYIRKGTSEHTYTTINEFAELFCFAGFFVENWSIDNSRKGA